MKRWEIHDRLRYLEDLAVALDVGIRKLKDDLDAEPDDVVDSEDES